MNPLLLIQDGAAAMPELTSLAEPVVEEVVQKISFFQMALKGGWIMIPLVLLLCLAIYIFIERCIALSQAKKEDPNFMNRIKDYIHSGNIESAIKLCKQTNTPAARMVEKGISRIGHPMNDV
ncbi:MAG: MotA/TolQ/ExbB proton channel family protein, partial [Bacteroidales bacterium]|nr:MotA/TolQ/ExbB proton channel family protein [Bacteroidales bacterium]